MRSVVSLGGRERAHVDGSTPKAASRETPRLGLNLGSGPLADRHIHLQYSRTESLRWSIQQPAIVILHLYRSCLRCLVSYPNLHNHSTTYACQRTGKSNTYSITFAKGE